MKCLILGGKGFLGSHLADALVTHGYDVRVFDRHGAITLSHPRTSLSVEWVDGDLNHEGDLHDALAGCDVVFHLVSTTLPISSNADPVFDIESNLVGSLRLLNHALVAGVKRIVFISSGGTVYGLPRYLPIDEAHPTDPICSYGIGKLAIEKYLALYQRLHGLGSVVLRLSNPFGERQAHSNQGAVNVFLKKALRGETIEIWGDGSIVRDYIFIDDCVDAMLKALTYPSTTPSVFNIGSGVGMSLNELLAEIEQVTGKETKRVYTKGRTFDVAKSVLAIGKAKDHLGWQPTTPFREGLRRTAQWLSTQEGAP